MLNLIPYNPNVTATLHGFEAPSIESCRAFGKIVIEGGLRVRLREEFGQDINAACGQLALATKDVEDTSMLAAAAARVDRGGRAKDIEDLAPPPAAAASPPPRRKARAPPPPPPRRTALATASLAAAALAASLAAAAAVLR